ncbi:hypothetical protein TTHERM_00040350 (macronuclear) [Tetrahymena thermophila SB210]|uniref:P25-alpha family protein n=1 Tax=Tetrahymena thermophila (strain SB210) TaxID=312017 RepID=Q22LY3_TETTS|nr:hypothetical protein TTHERM_00040350 [Tetrahymena thermophila SB210]EAR86390.1 hypothetical protein TTHERM_00040350 [Tetrahymena thermophila SB210]|eukprot:XP_977237.1 hypothetical protein TTHERM_00040350 [Tetrahymena thermophila SB210]
MSLSAAFKKFTNQRSTMDSKTFVNTLADSGIFNFKITTHQSEQIFEKVKNSPNLRGINYQQFETCLSLVASQTGCTRQQIEGLVLEYSKKFTTKQADPSRFFYDKSTYTGVHTKGGPSTLDNNGYSQLSQLCDRSSANVRGIKN